MVVLSNIFQSTINNFVNFYQNLTSQGRFAFFAVIFLVILFIVLVVMLIDQIYHSRQVNRYNSKPMLKEEVKQEIPVEEIDTDFDDENEKTRNIKEITQKIQAVIDSRGSDLDKYEQEQEETSIISYNELLQAAGKQKPIEDTETFKLPNLAHKIETDEIIERKDPIFSEGRESHFRNSDFISPIFGVQGRISESMPRQLREEQKLIENFTEELDITEIKESRNQKIYEEEEFLMSLKDLRNNLE